MNNIISILFMLFIMYGTLLISFIIFISAIVVYINIQDLPHTHFQILKYEQKNK